MFEFKLVLVFCLKFKLAFVLKLVQGNLELGLFQAKLVSSPNILASNPALLMTIHLFIINGSSPQVHNHTWLKALLSFNSYEQLYNLLDGHSSRPNWCITNNYTSFIYDHLLIEYDISNLIDEWFCMSLAWSFIWT